MLHSDWGEFVCLAGLTPSRQILCPIARSQGFDVQSQCPGKEGLATGDFRGRRAGIFLLGGSKFRVLKISAGSTGGSQGGQDETDFADTRDIDSGRGTGTTRSPGSGKVGHSNAGARSASSS